MSVFEGSKHLERPSGGPGVLISGVPGVEPARVVILGGGVVGLNAAKIASGVGAQVIVFDINPDRLRYLAEIMPPNVTTIYSNPLTVRQKIRQADLVIGAVLVAGAKAPVLVRREDVRSMKDHSVIVDVAVDQGGSVETARPTTHSNPTYVGWTREVPSRPPVPPPTATPPTSKKVSYTTVWPTCRERWPAPPRSPSRA
jgi:alanine dehydrogenase